MKKRVPNSNAHSWGCNVACTVFAAGWTALTYAALHQHADAIRVLLEAGASLDQRDVLGYDVRKYCEQPTLKQIDEAQSARAARPSSPRSPRS